MNAPLDTQMWRAFSNSVTLPFGFDCQMEFHTLKPPGIQSAPEYQTSTQWAMGGWVIDDSAFFSSDFKGAPNAGKISGMRWPNCTKFWKT